MSRKSSLAIYSFNNYVGQTCRQRVRPRCASALKSGAYFHAHAKPRSPIGVRLRCARPSKNDKIAFGHIPWTDRHSSGFSNLNAFNTFRKTASVRPLVNTVRYRVPRGAEEAATEDDSREEEENGSRRRSVTNLGRFEYRILNKEFRMMNRNGNTHPTFVIRNSLFDIQYPSRRRSALSVETFKLALQRRPRGAE